MKTRVLSLVLSILAWHVQAQIPTLTLQQVITGFSTVTTLAHCNDDRMFVCEQAGRIKFFRPNSGSNTITTFMDINARVGDNGNERGLLGLAFAPDYATSGRFYVNYTNNSGNTVVSRFRVNASDPNLGDPNSEEILLTITQPYSNHNGGCILFGPDGYLYVGMGDGGSAGDPENRAQNRQSLLGKMLRLDVNTTGATYAIPASNPFTTANDPNNTTLDEIWAIGVRNPWRYSFDRLTGDLWIGDVGQNLWEEVDFQPAGFAGGANYGWRCYEGNVSYSTSGCQAQSTYQAPVFVFSHSLGCSITGGYVYRGNLYSNLYGRYFVTDYCSGRIWSIYPDANNAFINELHGQYTQNTYTAFGEDQFGEVYIAQQNGVILRLTSPNALPMAAITAGGSLSVCEGDPVELSTGYHPSLSYAWFKDNDPIAGADSNVYVATVSGSYQVRVTSAAGDSLSEPVTVTVFPIPATPEASASIDTLCADAAFPIPLEGNPAGGTFSGNYVQDNSFVTFGTPAGTYTIEYRVTENGCTSEAATFNVVIHPLPNVSLSGINETYCVNSPDVNLVLDPIGGELNGPGTSGSVFSPATAGIGTHQISYGILSEEGCYNLASFTVTVDECTALGNSAASMWLAFPNPTKGQFTIQHPYGNAAVSLQLFNASGQCVRSMNLQQSQTMVSMDALSAGLYHLVLRHEGEVLRMNLVHE